MIFYIRHVHVLKAIQIDKHQRKPKGQLIMNNLEKFAARQREMKKKDTKQKTKKMCNKDRTKKTGDEAM